MSQIRNTEFNGGRVHVVLPRMEMSSGMDGLHLNALCLVLEGFGMYPCIMDESGSSAIPVLVGEETRIHSEIIRARNRILQHQSLTRLISLAALNTSQFAQLNWIPPDLESMHNLTHEVFCRTLIQQVSQSITDYNLFWKSTEFTEQPALDRFMSTMINEQNAMNTLLHARTVRHSQ
uniref:Ferritin n=1 Tax=Timspurckia oligopyrenoides TaxID=708627 RepID=A0A7S0ZFV7_9RHOD|mmetsp:Transcript_3693/g.6467  ORF Transcript_3693/g.6467 Transcript_3693/m.6467 type:complete len:177 (+) Transcript_3693:168-698(+)